MRHYTQDAALGGHLHRIEETAEIAIELEIDNTAIMAT